MTRHRNRHHGDRDAWIERRTWTTCTDCGKRSFETRSTAKTAGRILDGRTWDEFPAVTS